MKLPILYLVSTPIGNPEDITLRAVRLLGESPLLIAESFSAASRLLKELGIKKEIIMELNEHNQSNSDYLYEIISEIKKMGNACLISDAGTPCVADPGNSLVGLCAKSGIYTTAVPGSSSILSALTVSGMTFQSFRYIGFPPRDKEEREKFFQKIQFHGLEPIILQDTPYRMEKMLSEVGNNLRGEYIFCLAMDLTKDTEKIFRGNKREFLKIIKNPLGKAEFILILRRV